MVTETDWDNCPNITKIVKDVFDGLYTDEHKYISYNLNDDLCGKNRVYTYNYDTALAEYNRNTQQAENDYNSAMQSYNATVASIDQQYEDDRASYNDYLQKKREYDNYMQQLNTYNAECARIDREYGEAMRQYEQDLEEYNRTYGN